MKIKKMKIKEMKRTIKIMSLLFLSIITLTTFSSCERTVFDQENELVGSWVSTTYHDNTYSLFDRLETISFFEEGAGIGSFLDYVDDDGREHFMCESFIYTIGEKQFSIGGYICIIEKVDKETLVLSCNGVKKEFKRKK